MQRYRGSKDPSRQDPDPPGPVYEPDVLIAEDKSIEAVKKTLEQNGIEATVDDKAPDMGPFKLLRLTPIGDTSSEDLVYDAMEDLFHHGKEQTRSLEDDPPIVQPNYIHGAPQMRGGVYAVPDPVTMPDLDIVPSAIGNGVKVLVIDTEYNESPKIPDPGPTYPPPEDPPLSGNLAPAAGHCTFVIGQILRVAPGADIIPPRVALDGFGVGTDTALLTQLHQIMISTDPLPDLVNLSLGYYTLFDDPPMAIGYALETLQNTGTVIVAAAGNEDDDRPWFPAADLDRAVSVGAVVRVSGAWARAAYSNYGDWVDFVARGLNEGPFIEWTQQPQPYGGWARWGGTSFSTPLVVGQLAALMTTHSISGVDAVDLLKTLSAAAPADFPNARVVVPTELWGQS